MTDITARIRVLSVATGEYTADQLQGADADWVVATLEDGPLPF